jgi:hypothetical protein
VTFEYGETDGYGTETTGTTETGTGAISEGIIGLKESTLYHFRIKAVGTYGTVYGSDAIFTTLTKMTWIEGNGLIIYVSGNSYPNSWIQCGCKRWDEGNWDTIIETYLSSGARNFLLQNITPGAYRELYNILGTPHFIDTTYTSGNTIILEPQHGYAISSVRQKRTITIKNITEQFINPNYYGIKIDGYIL